MFGSPVIEVLIGIIFIYSLFSILVTQINTFISNALQMRSHHLYEGLTDLLNDPVLRAKLIVHPLVRFSKNRQFLPGTIDEQTAVKVLNDGLENIKYIDSDNFVTALLDVINADDPAVMNKLFNRMQSILEAMPESTDRQMVRTAMNSLIMSGTGVEALRGVISRVDETAYRHALNDALEDLEEDMSQYGLPLEGNLRLLAGLQTIEDPYMRATLETLLLGSHTLDTAKERIKKWFDARMEQASEAFTYKMERYSLIVGLIIALLINVDTLYITQTLWNDPALRQTIAIAAENTNLDQLQATVDEAATSAEDDTTSFEELSANLAALNTTADRIATLRLPMGWSLEDLSDDTDASLRDDRRYLWNFLPQNNDQWAYLIFLKILGIGATTVAIAQGAPFWFNLLRRVSNQ